MQNHESFSMVQECTDSYKAEEQKDGKLKISILIPKRFGDLWLVKLSELRTTMEEIEEYEQKND